MAIRKVARMGHPVLRKKARELAPEEIQTPEVQRLIADMIDTMHEYGGVGLAAPQVHEPLRIAIIELDPGNPRYDIEEALGLNVYINPKIEILDDSEQGYWEGCLSVPGMRGLVFRPSKVRVEALDAMGKTKVLEAEGFLATVFQHEFDHLDGKLYVDRIRDLSNFMFEKEYERYHLNSDFEEMDEE